MMRGRLPNVPGLVYNNLDKSAQRLNKGLEGLVMKCLGGVVRVVHPLTIVVTDQVWVIVVLIVVWANSQLKRMICKSTKRRKC